MELPDSFAFTWYFIKKQIWKTNSNQSSVAEAAALKAEELYGTEWRAFSRIPDVFSYIAKG